MNSSHHRLATYAAMAATPVVGSALGDVTYVSLDLTVNANDSYTVSQTGSQASFSFDVLPVASRGTASGSTYFNFAFCDFLAKDNVNWLAEIPASSADFPDEEGFFQRFAQGEMISSQGVLHLVSSRGWVATTSTYGFDGYQTGAFANIDGSPQSGYIGFTFMADDGDGDEAHYGYVSLTWDGTDLTLHGYAWENVGGQGIVAGAGQPVVPGLGGLAALAIGAAGIRSRRQRTVA